MYMFVPARLASEELSQLALVVEPLGPSEHELAVASRCGGGGVILSGGWLSGGGGGGGVRGEINEIVVAAVAVITSYVVVSSRIVVSARLLRLRCGG